MTLHRLLVFAPTRRAASETFVRANLEGLPFAVKAYFGDERPWGQPDRLAYGLSVLLSKVCTRLGLLRLAGWPAAVVARMLIAVMQLCLSRPMIKLESTQNLKRS